MQAFDDGELERKFDAEWTRLQQDVKKPGILLAGVTGAGKSSLANMVFGEDIFTVGVGVPVTQATSRHEAESVIIYDTKGCETRSAGTDGRETGGVEEFRRDVLGPAKTDGQVEYNIAWYCIPGSCGRVTPLDLSVIGEIAKAGIPVAVVFTKIDEAAREDLDAMKAQIPSSFPMFETSTLMKEINHVDELVSWSIERLPEQLRVAFIKQQTINFEAKRKQVRIMIAESVGAAGIVGASPIPFSDAPLLVANEMILMARILNLYNLGSLGNSLKSMGMGGIMSMLGKVTAKTLATSILKFIPGIGTAAGAVAGSFVAVTFTWAFGGAVSAAAQNVWKAQLSGNTQEMQSIINGFGDAVAAITQANIDSGKTSAEAF